MAYLTVSVPGDSFRIRLVQWASTCTMWFPSDEFLHTLLLPKLTKAKFLKQCISQYSCTAARELRVPVHSFTSTGKIVATIIETMSERKRRSSDRETFINATRNKTEESNWGHTCTWHVSSQRNWNRTVSRLLVATKIERMPKSYTRDLTAIINQMYHNRSFHKVRL